jgi:hypothetical protein
VTVERRLRIGGLTVIALGFVTLFTDELVLGSSANLLAGCPYGSGECFNSASPAYERLLLVGILLIAIGIATTVLSSIRRFNQTSPLSNSSQNGSRSGLS